MTTPTTTNATDAVVKLEQPSMQPTLSEWATRINNEFVEIERANINVVERAIAFGKTLHQAKEKVGHGNWLDWLKTNCSKVSERSATRYINLAAKEMELREKMKTKSATVADLSLNAALALVRSSGGGNGSDKYDKKEAGLIKSLTKMQLPEAEAAATETIRKIECAPLALGVPVCADFLANLDW